MGGEAAKDINVTIKDCAIHLYWVSNACCRCIAEMSPEFRV